MPNKTTAQRQADAAAMLAHFDKWIHAAVLLGYIAQDYGAPAAEVDAVLLADKAEIDRRLMERIRANSEG